MIKISKKVEYALMAIKFIHDKGPKGLTSTRELCDHLHIPFDTLAKVMQSLNSSGLITSVQGVKGGYRLERQLNEIDYLELTEIVEKKKFALDCMQGQCDLHNTCNISTPLTILNRELKIFFQGLTLKQLLEAKDLVEIEKVNEYEC